MSSGHIVKYNFKLKCKYFATLNVVFNSIHHTSIGDIFTYPNLFNYIKLFI